MAKTCVKDNGIRIKKSIVVAENSASVSNQLNLKTVSITTRKTATLKSEILLNFRLKCLYFDDWETPKLWI